MTFNCGNCARDDLDCACPEGPVHFCVTCGLAPSTSGSDDCMPCTAAYLITDPTQMALIQKLHAGTAWLLSLNAEVNRQLCTPVACGRSAA